MWYVPGALQCVSQLLKVSGGLHANQKSLAHSDLFLEDFHGMSDTGKKSFRNILAWSR